MLFSFRVAYIVGRPARAWLLSSRPTDTGRLRTLVVSLARHNALAVASKVYFNQNGIRVDTSGEVLPGGDSAVDGQ
jgi:hypothetical protein